jgi:hypothetical protein
MDARIVQDERKANPSAGEPFGRARIPLRLFEQAISEGIRRL